jgi:Uma2 family endonuclease
MNNSRQAIPQTGERMTAEEYFRLDDTVPEERYEYQNGAIRLREGATAAHCEITGSIQMILRGHFRTGPCVVRSSIMRVQISESAYFFPDLTVTCDLVDQRRGTTLLRYPRLVVEVFSPATEKVDRVDKLRAYQACPTIEEIVLVSQFAPHVEIFRRYKENKTEWKHVCYEVGEEVVLESVNVVIPMEEIYYRIDFDESLVGGS